MWFKWDLRSHYLIRTPEFRRSCFCVLMCYINQIAVWHWFVYTSSMVLTRMDSFCVSSHILKSCTYKENSRLWKGHMDYQNVIVWLIASVSFMFVVQRKGNSFFLDAIVEYKCFLPNSSWEEWVKLNVLYTERHPCHLVIINWLWRQYYKEPGKRNFTS